MSVLLIDDDPGIRKLLPKELQRQGLEQSNLDLSIRYEELRLAKGGLESRVEERTAELTRAKEDLEFLEWRLSFEKARPAAKETKKP